MAAKHWLKHWRMALVSPFEDRGVGRVPGRPLLRGADGEELEGPPRPAPDGPRRWVVPPPQRERQPSPRSVPAGGVGTFDRGTGQRLEGLQDGQSVEH